MKARAVAGVVDHRAADPVPAVVLAELDRVGAAGDPLVGPVEPVRSGLVGDPVLVGIPERPRLEHHDLPSRVAPAAVPACRRPHPRRRSRGRPRTSRRSAPSARAARLGGGRRAGTPSRSRAAAARRAAACAARAGGSRPPHSALLGVLDGIALERRRALPALALADARGGRSRAGTRARRSRSRSTPRDASRTR